MAAAPEVSRALYLNSPLGQFFRHAPSRRHRTRPPKGLKTAAAALAAEQKTRAPFKKGRSHKPS